MPQVKNNFLGSKMNLDLDYRLIPEGEYVIAQNIQITKSEGSDVGVVQNVKGNSLAYTSALFSTGYECIGSFFDDKENRIFWFVTNDTDHKILLWNTGDTAPDVIVSGDFLNFRKSNLITGINLVENYLFWTDDRNEPRRIDVNKAIIDPTFYNNYLKIKVAKFSPYLAPEISMSRDPGVSSRYIEDKFVRFSYRFKFDDNEFSQIAPFTQIAFKTQSDTLTAQQVEDAWKQGLLKDFINHINSVEITIPLPGNFVSDYEVKSVDILIKDSSSTAVQILKTIDVTSSHETAGEIVYTYKSEFPSRTLANDQVVRVSDNVPIRAKSQEVVGNRLVYGNYTQDYDQTTASYTIDISQKSESLALEYPYHSVKQRRNYEIGLVLSDREGRKSPVILSNTSTIYVPAKGPTFDSDTWRGDCLRINFSTLPTGDWYSYRVVVKQLEQDYYNVYIPGVGTYKDTSYITLIGDNVNKVPRNTNDVDISTNLASSNTRLYPKVINKSYYNKGLEPFEINDGKIAGGLYKVVNNSVSMQDSYLSGYISADIQKFDGGDLSGVSSNQLDLNLDTAVTDAGGDYVNPGVITSPNTVYVFVNGMYVNPSDYSYSYSTGSYGRITWSQNTPSSSDLIDVVLKWDRIKVGPQLNPAFEVGSLGILSLSYGASPTITKLSDIESTLSVSVYDPYENNYIFNYVYQVQSDGNILNVGSVGTINQFSEIDQTILPEADEAGFYKINNNNLIAELPFDSSYQKIYDFASNGLAGMAADLAVFETEPFNSVLDIYYETSTSGLISDLSTGVDIEIKFFNTFIIKGDDIIGEEIWHIEESRIKGDFNANSVDIGVQAHLVDPDYKRTTRYNSLIYSGLYNARTGVNNTNQFLPGDGASKSLDPQQGSIQKLFAENDNLTVFQENKVSWIAIDKDVLYTAEGEPQVIASNNVLGQVVSYAGEYGIGENPESFAYYAGRKYFACVNKGVILRLSRDGITEISNYGMRSYFRDNLKNATKIHGSWDIHNKVYSLSMRGGSIDKTVSFDEESNGWVSFYPYISEMSGSMNGSYYTTKLGDLWLHYSNDTRNSFYGGASQPSYIKTVVNAQPSIKKNFLTLGYEGTEDWYTNNILTDTQGATSYDQAESIAKYNIVNQDAIISAYKKQNNSYVANIINNSSSKANEVIFGDIVSGIKGMYMELTMITDSTNYSELFTVTSNFNINNY